ncbi:hypothetical protein EGI26_01780 [Lacihabitans sp. CCS-44]|uniref:hypothetical protein n=1 Tax=Lacihabitans sp. CCS-44 TaxID=2487331 RepID=UPI0020CD167C|nr:hypothetical protein [Lacihabitans sp. CCS-44]MCP9753890.1 hypothetical protein [Lacihabitans sp. CCS-44]
MKKNVILLVILSFWSCKEGDLYVSGSIKGEIKIQNNVLETEIQDKKNIDVYISNDSTGSPYLISTKTDSLGKFEFEYFPSKNKKTLYLIAEKNIGGIKYRKVQNFNNESQIANFSITPIYSGKQIVVTIKDNSDLINNAEVYLFISESQAKTIANENPEGLIQTRQNSNQKGKAIFYNLTSSKYYLVSRLNKQYSKIEVVDLTNKDKVEILLSILPPTQSPKLNIKVLDSQGDVVSGIETFIFSSSLFLPNLKSNPVAGYIGTGKTNNKGEYQFSDLPVNQNLYIASKGYFLKNNKIDTTYTFLEKPIKLSQDTTVSLLFK